MADNNVTISFNGKDVRTLKLTPLKGIVDAILKPAQYKPVITNENAAIDGSMVVTTGTTRKVQKRDVVLPFYLKTEGLSSLQSALSDIESELVLGMKETGVNDVTALGTTYHMVFQGISSFSNFGNDGTALISIKFTEYNPKSRS